MMNALSSGMKNAPMRNALMQSQPVQAVPQQRDPLPGELRRLGIPEQAWPRIGEAISGQVTEMHLRQYGDLDDGQKSQVWKNVIDGMSLDEAFQPPGYDPRGMVLQGGDGTDGIDGAERNDKLTEGQGKTLVYFERGLNANRVLDNPKMATALGQYSDTFAGKFGAVGRNFQDAEYQVAKRAADEFLAAILRKDTGAAITSQEFELYAPMYLPMPGDKPELLEEKRIARGIALRALERSLGSARGYADDIKSEQQQSQTPAPMAGDDPLGLFK